MAQTHRGSTGSLNGTPQETYEVLETNSHGAFPTGSKRPLDSRVVLKRVRSENGILADVTVEEQLESLSRGSHSNPNLATAMSAAMHRFAPPADLPTINVHLLRAAETLWDVCEAWWDSTYARVTIHAQHQQDQGNTLSRSMECFLRHFAGSWQRASGAIKNQMWTAVVKPPPPSSQSLGSSSCGLLADNVNCNAEGVGRECVLTAWQELEKCGSFSSSSSSATRTRIMTDEHQLWGQAYNASQCHNAIAFAMLHEPRLALRCLDMAVTFGQDIMAGGPSTGNATLNLITALQNVLKADAAGPSDYRRWMAANEREVLCDYDMIEESQKPGQLSCAYTVGQLAVLSCPSLEAFQEWHLQQEAVVLRGCMEKWPALVELQGLPADDMADSTGYNEYGDETRSLWNQRSFWQGVMVGRSVPLHVLDESIVASNGGKLSQTSVRFVDFDMFLDQLISSRRYPATLVRRPSTDKQPSDRRSPKSPMSATPEDSDATVLDSPSQQRGVVMAMDAHDLLAQVPTLQELIRTPDFTCLGSSSRLHTSVAFNPRGLTWHLRRYPQHTFLCQVVGLQSVHLIRPTSDGSITAHCAGNDPTQSAFDIKQRSMEASGVKCHEWVLNPGEMLFVPSGWWLKTESLTPSIGVMFHWQ
eukprot:Clim_evm84s25 gene=Clim_evmTU84s25